MLLVLFLITPSTCSSFVKARFRAMSVVGANRRYPLGVWIALIALLLLFLAWGMQAFSLMNWEKAVELGLQNERFDGDEAKQAWALESWGVAMADMIWPLPICVAAFIGIIRKKFYGYSAGLMGFAIGVYFPLFYAFQRWNMFRSTAIVTLILWTIPSLLGIIGLWLNRKVFTQS